MSKHPARTLVEMAAIPLDVLPRFLAELPDLLAAIRALDVNAGCAGTIKCVWIDDDKRQLIYSVSDQAGTVLFTATHDYPCGEAGA